MQGSNTLKLNEASMIEMVQYYIDNKMFNPNEPRPKVKSCKSTNSGYSNEFEIIMEAPDGSAS